MPAKVKDPKKPKTPLWRRIFGIGWTDKSKWHVYELCDGFWWFWVRKTGPTIERDEEWNEDPDEVIAAGVPFDEAMAKLTELRASGRTGDDGKLKTRYWFVMLPSKFYPGGIRHVTIG